MSQGTKKVKKAWTREETNQLIALFEQNPDLWDFRRPYYSNR